MKSSKLAFNLVAIVITFLVMTAFFFVVGFVIENIIQNNHGHEAYSNIKCMKNEKVVLYYE